MCLKAELTASFAKEKYPVAVSKVPVTEGVVAVSSTSFNLLLTSLTKPKNRKPSTSPYIVRIQNVQI